MSKKADIKKVLIELRWESWNRGFNVDITPYMERIMKIVEASDE